MTAITNTSHDPRTIRLLEAPILSTLLAPSGLNAPVMLTQAAVSMLEVYFLSRLGLDVLAGVSEVFPLVALVAAISTGTVGGGIVSAIARALGQGRRSDAGDPTAIAAGCDYLRQTGPYFGLFGAGFALYCAAQGTDRMA